MFSLNSPLLIACFVALFLQQSQDADWEWDDQPGLAADLAWVNIIITTVYTTTHNSLTSCCCSLTIIICSGSSLLQILLSHICFPSCYPAFIFTSFSVDNVHLQTYSQSDSCEPSDILLHRAMPSVGSV